MIFGRRIMPNAAGFLPPEFQPGDYGRATFDTEESRRYPDLLWWQVEAPDGSCCKLNPKVHTVTEHDDGTITVQPSIVTHSWHGWLHRGVWTKA